jgi:hypothetical protein
VTMCDGRWRRIASPIPDKGVTRIMGIAGTWSGKLWFE